MQIGALDGFRMSCCSMDTKPCFPCFLGSFEFAVVMDSEMFRTKRLYNLYFSPSAAHPLRLHTCGVREHLPLLIGNTLSTTRPSDYLPINNPLTEAMQPEETAGFEVKYSDLKPSERPHCSRRPAGGCSLPWDKRKPSRNSAQDPWLIILITQYFNPPCQPFPLCLAAGMRFPKRLELTAMGKPHTDQSADKSKNPLLYSAPPASRNAHKLWPASTTWVKNQILRT